MLLERPISRLIEPTLAAAWRGRSIVSTIQAVHEKQGAALALQQIRLGQREHRTFVCRGIVFKVGDQFGRC